MRWIPQPILVYRNLNLLATPNAVFLGSGILYGWNLYSLGKADQFVKFYDKASTPVVGVDVAKLTIGIKPSQPDNEYPPGGVLFKFGIWIACTTGQADSSTTPPTVNTQIAHVFYL